MKKADKENKGLEYVEKGNKPIRLNKYLADSGICSRRKADDLIKSRTVRVNGNIVTEMGIKVTHTDFITVKGDPIKEVERHIYIILNKPKNTITTTSDEQGRRTVMDIVKKQARLYPVGRLDRNTTGVLLITNDGELANRLIHPRYQVERIYVAKLDAELQLEHAQKIAQGIELPDFKTSPCELLIHPDNHSKVTIALREGKNREVRKIFESLGYEVKQLDRKYFATLSTQGLQKGEYRHLSTKELKELKRSVKITD